LAVRHLLDALIVKPIIRPTIPRGTEIMGQNSGPPISPRTNPQKRNRVMGRKHPPERHPNTGAL